MKKPAAVESGSEAIDARIKELGDWRGKTLAKVRKIIHAADPDIVEEWKWAKASSPGTPVWSHDGIVCTGGVQEQRQDDVREGRGAERPFRSLQLEPGGKRQARHRHS